MFGTARFIVKKQCQDLGFNVETLTPEQARQVVDKLEKIIRDIYGKKIADGALHEMRVLIAKYDGGKNIEEDDGDKKGTDKYIFRMNDSK